ncbi:hypothetical protein Leryth_003732 [Lithospermum erythrorhizon]|nr:hypothetical protein Leryth_003732 [Lithospermum erythrorhizon]
MGNLHVKEKNHASERVVRGLKNKVRHLESEINEIMCLRESEREAFERELMVFAIKENEWRKERRKLKGEIKKMRKKLDCFDGRFGTTENNNNELQNVMEEDRVIRRDETMEKWKELYFAVKFELDNLIHKTSQGETVYLTAEEDCCTVKEMEKQLKAKEETIEILEAQLVSMEQRESKREREVDILKQSLRIMSHKRKPTKVATNNILVG